MRILPLPQSRQYITLLHPKYQIIINVDEEQICHVILERNTSRF